MALHPGGGDAVARRRDRRAVRSGGPAVALAQVRAVAARVAIPVVGMGGVPTGSARRGLLEAGATLVAVGTETSATRPRATGSRPTSTISPQRAGTIVELNDGVPRAR